MTVIRLFFRLLKEAPQAQVAALLVLMLLSGLSEGVGVLLLVPLLEMLQNHGQSANVLARDLIAILQTLGFRHSAGGVLAAFFVLVAFRSGVQFLRERLGAGLQYRLVDDLRQRCFAALLRVEWRWIAQGRKSDQANLLLTDVSRVGVGLNFGISLLATLGTMAAYLSAAFVLSWSMTAVALASGLLVLWFLSGHRKKALDLGQKLGAANRNMQGYVQESLAGIKLAKIMGNERRHLDQFAHTTANLRQEQFQFMVQNSLVRALFQVGGALLLVLYLYAGLALWHIALAELIPLVLVFGRLIPMFMSGQQALHQWLHAVPALQDIDRLLADCHTWAEPEAGGGGVARTVKECICMEGVTVRYADRERPALDGVSLRLAARTTTAVMGPSGAGKSTLADVLIGLLAPDAGTVTVDGVALTGAERMRWRHAVAYVPQEVFLFHDSIRNNLLWGRPDADEAELRRVLGLAAAGFVFDLPQGLDTLVGDGGVRLSGGERQRIALARALLRQPALLILDEATSALDLENEARVREAIEHLHGDLTVVIIGHRLATLEHADQVVVLDAGRIALQGTWPEVKRHLGTDEWRLN